MKSVGVVLLVSAVVLASISLSGCPSKEPEAAGGGGGAASRQMPQGGSSQPVDQDDGGRSATAPRSAADVPLTLEKLQQCEAASESVEVYEISGDLSKPDLMKDAESVRAALDRCRQSADLAPALKKHGISSVHEYLQVMLKVAVGAPEAMDAALVGAGADREEDGYKAMMAEVERQAKPFREPAGDIKLSDEEKRVLAAHVTQQMQGGFR